jgi:hypothetical protein
MSATPKDVQAHLDIATFNLKKTQISGINFIKEHGTDWTKWPKTSFWYIAFQAIAIARKEAGQLTVPILSADFTAK